MNINIHPAIIAYYRHVHAMRSSFVSIKIKKTEAYKIWARWIMTHRSIYRQGGLFLPDNRQTRHDYQIALELREKGATQSIAFEHYQRFLCKAGRACHPKLVATCEYGGFLVPSGSAVKVYRNKATSEVVFRSSHLTFSLPRHIYEKLLRRMIKHASVSYIWLMAVNYWLLDGKSLQWATPPAVMQVLQAYGCRTELFASPMNVYQENNYYSLFHADRYFASRGNFFRAPPEHFASGVFQINPPFIDILFSRCTRKITGLLEQADHADRHLTFIYIMPDWDDFFTLQELRGHKYCIRDIYLAPGSHNYYQYGHNNYIRATFGTHVIILSTDPGFCDSDFERDVVRAFRCGV